MESLFENFKFLFELYFRPQRAMSNIIDRGSWIFGAVIVLIVSFAFQYGVNQPIAQTYAVSRFDLYQTQSNFDKRMPDNGSLTPAQLSEAEYYADLDIENELARERRPFPLLGRNVLWLFAFETNNFLSILLALAVFYVPTTILLVTLFEPIGSFGLLLRRDYSVTVACTLMAWAAAHLPFAIAGIALRNVANIDGSVFLILWLTSGIMFGVLMIFALRTVFGASYKSAISTVCLSWLSISVGGRIFNYISPFLFSPFLLFYAFLYFRGEAGTISGAFRQRQNFRRFLNNATINPNDAEAHVQLGLLYNQRRQTADALKHFEKATAIEPQEIDANYELGKLARQAGDLETALKRFSIVVEQNDKHAASEIWREIGATYLAAHAQAEAREFLEKFIERRPFDPEGLYLLGQTLKAQNEQTAAQEMFRRCIEAVQTSPEYRRGVQRKWAKLAKNQLRITNS